MTTPSDGENLDRSNGSGNKHNREDEDSEDYDEDDSSSYSSFNSDLDDEAERMMMALGNDIYGQQQQPQVNTRTPRQEWDDYLQTILPTTQSLKISDSLVLWATTTKNAADEEPVDDQQQQEQERIQELYSTLTTAIQSCPKLVHVILGRRVLCLLSSEQQTQLYEIILQQHASTVTFFKLGSDDSQEPCPNIPTECLLKLLAQVNWNLTELEIRGLTLSTVQQVQYSVQMMQNTSASLRQVNLWGMDIRPALMASGLLDPLLQACQEIPGFDELQLSRWILPDASPEKPSDVPPLITPAVFENMLSTKPKWWRLSLNGMGLDDRHMNILASALSSNKDCKMNDVLSVQNNPNISEQGYRRLYEVCINKQRMGLVQSDHPTWVATANLVRPLNNLHRRLDYVTGDGGYTSREQWVEWLALVGNLPWLEEARKLNYVWFALLEQPDFVRPELSTTNGP